MIFPACPTTTISAKKERIFTKKVEQEFFHGIYLQGYILSGLPYALNRRFSSLSVIGITVP